MTVIALIALIAVAVGWVGRDLWDACIELIDLYREETKD